MCKLRELQDGTYSIYDVDDMHELLDMQAEIHAQMSAQAEQEARSKRGKGR